ncbi:MAG TPA: flagellar hook-associated protein FlgK [Steroidobacteraceae bacterium]|nr:flagellar hook-associated protein FlgK [Steroidobacteraceae bacterium]
MSDVFGISVSALQAFQSAISVTSNNIANANTPGYARESIDLTSAAPQANGVLSVGNGVVVNGISRTFSQATANQLNASQSSLGQLTALQSYSSQIDNLVGTTAGGLSTAVQGFYSAWSDVANSPTSTATRQALLGKAQSVASTFQSTSSQLDALNTDINSRITSDVQQINTLGASISTLNKQIIVSTAQSGGQVPNDLIDQRDQLVSNLSKLTGITTTTDSNGSLNVFVGNGQPLVLQGNTTTLTTVPNQFDASQLEVSTSTSSGNVISSQITSGDLGGLLAARSQVVNPAKNQLGQIATAFTETVNSQQNAGLDLTGKLGTNLFSVGAPLATASSKNTGGATATVSVASVGALTANDYVLSYKGGAYSLTNAADGSAVSFSGSGTSASPLTADGLSIVLSATPASGDQFLIQPTAQAAGSISSVITDPSQIAAAGAVQTSPASANTGTSTISSGTVVNAANANLLTTATIQFTTPTTYSINGAGSYTYAAGGNITQNGWQVQISGVPAAGDSFTVQSNAGATGDNRNALLGASQQTLPVLGNGTISVNGAVSALVTGIGSQAQQINTAQTAQTAVNSQAVSNQQSVSGVNLDEEAAKLLQWQQAYQAAAKALQIGSSLFQSLLTAVQSA